MSVALTSKHLFYSEMVYHFSSGALGCILNLKLAFPDSVQLDLDNYILFSHESVLYGFLFHSFTFPHPPLWLSFPHIIPVQHCHSPPSILFSSPACMFARLSHFLSFSLLSLPPFLSLLILSYLCLICVLKFISYLELVLRCPEFIFMLTSPVHVNRQSLLPIRCIPYLWEVSP